MWTIYVYIIVSCNGLFLIGRLADTRFQKQLITRYRLGETKLCNDKLAPEISHSSLKLSRAICTVYAEIFTWRKFSPIFAYACRWWKFIPQNFCPVKKFSPWGVLTATSCSFWRPLLARCRYYLIFKLHLGGTWSLLQDRYHQISEANAAVDRAAQRAKKRGA